jgi:transposase-like protein
MRHSGMRAVPVKQSASGSLVRGVRRDFGAMQKRRMRAAELFEQGVIPAEVARQVGVSHQIVSDWRAAWRQSGRDGMRRACWAIGEVEPRPTCASRK